MNLSRYENLKSYVTWERGSSLKGARERKRYRGEAVIS
jgi:hypothetical protein